ncbi:MAG: outer membrane protein transport protein [Porticoccus sp.]|nr:outer membrane protein transport protein [Porticoccus sp.]
MLNLKRITGSARLLLGAVAMAALIRSALITFSIFWSTQSLAGGAYIYEMANTTDIGTAGAGLAAKAQDASVVFNNPAGMTRIHRPEIQAGGALLYLKAPFDSGSGTTITGPDSNTTEWFAGGNFSYVHPLDNDFTVGLSFQNFFGLTLDWDHKWKGRYSTHEEWLIAPQLQPTIAYKVNDTLSVGAGAALTYGYLKSKLAVDNPVAGTDGKAEVEDTDTAVQGNFGVMIEPTKDTRIGIRYLTETKLDFDDKISTSGIGPIGEAVLDDLGAIDLGLYMPQAINVSIFHQVNSDWALLGSLGWEDWSKFGKVEVGFDNLGRITTEDYHAKDSYHFGIATQYQYDPELMLSAGFSFDSEMFSDKNRPIAFPMGDMYRYGVGFEKSVEKDFTFGGGLDLIWEGDVPVKDYNEAAGDIVDSEYEDVYFVFATLYGVWKF